MCLRCPPAPLQVHPHVPGFPVEAQELVIPERAVQAPVAHVRLRDDSGPDVQVVHLKVAHIGKRVGEPEIELALRQALVPLARILHEHVGAGSVGRLEHEGTGKHAEIDLVEPVPHAQERDQVLFADGLRDPFAYRVLVRQSGEALVALVKLAPLDLFAERAGFQNVHGPAHILKVFVAQPPDDLVWRGCGH